MEKEMRGMKVNKKSELSNFWSSTVQKIQRIARQVAEFTHICQSAADHAALNGEWGKIPTKKESGWSFRMSPEQYELMGSTAKPHVKKSLIKKLRG